MIKGSIFGVRIIPREDFAPLIKFYTVDDEQWFPVDKHSSFDARWLSDIIAVLEKAKQQTEIP